MTTELMNFSSLQKDVDNGYSLTNNLNNVKFF